MIKSYTSRPSALRGLTRHLGTANTPELNLAALIKQEGNQFSFDTDEADRAAGLGGLTEEEENIKLATGHSHCPSCNISLTNGWTDFEGMADCNGQGERAAYKLMQHEFMCLGCNHQWGKPVVLKPARAASNKTGRTYPNRAKSDIENPSEIVYALADAMAGEKRKAVVDAAIAKGVTPNTARAAYQHWRRDRGLTKTA